MWIERRKHFVGGSQCKLEFDETVLQPFAKYLTNVTITQFFDMRHERPIQWFGSERASKMMHDVDFHISNALQSHRKPIHFSHPFFYWWAILQIGLAPGSRISPSDSPSPSWDLYFDPIVDFPIHFYNTQIMRNVKISGELPPSPPTSSEGEIPTSFGYHSQYGHIDSSLDQFHMAGEFHQGTPPPQMVSFRPGHLCMAHPIFYGSFFWWPKRSTALLLLINIIPISPHHIR